VFNAGRTLPRSWLIWPETGCASIAANAMAAPNYFPPALKSAFASRNKIVGLRHPPLCCGPQAGAFAIVSGRVIAIEAAVVAGSTNSK
jgi:hypothetical protein